MIPRKDKPGRVAAIEVMIATPAIRNLIREGKTYQINSQIQTGAKFGMQSMDGSLSGLNRNGIITQEEAVLHAADQDNLMRFIG